jgi:hypothetical protein
MKSRDFLRMVIGMTLLCGMIIVGCDVKQEEYNPPPPDNTISRVSISLYYGDETPKVGSQLTASARNVRGNSVSGESYQWKRADSRYSTFVNINNATSNRYTPTIEDTGKYIKVEARNSNTTYPVESDIVGPVDANQVVKPTADPAGGEVVSGQEITLTSSTDGYITIYYTIDGSTPTKSSTQYSSYPKPKITSSCTLKAIATRSGMVDSEILSVSYTVVTAPSFSSVSSSASIFEGGIYSVAYGNNRFVAGGNAGRFAYSTNGSTWTNSTGTESFIVNAITYGTQFVAVGYFGIINYSSDGISWNNVTETTFETSYINDVAYGGGRYIAVGEDGKMAYSTNGSSWTAIANSTFGTSDIYGITYAAGKFVAVGASGKMAYSTNGTTWTAVTDSKFSTSTIYGITYGGSSGKEKFIAVGGSYIAYSTDGISWTSATSGYYASGLFSRGLNRIAWGGNKFVAVASAGVMLYSLDGINWARIDGGTGAGKTQFDTDSLSTIRDIVYGNGRFLAVGSKSNGLLSVSSSEMAISN